MRLETLEPRLMLNANAAGSEDLPWDPSLDSAFAETAAISAGSTTSEQDPGGFARFASAAELQAFLVDDALERYGGLFGQPAYPYWYYPCLDTFINLPTGGPEAIAYRDHSDTNTQVAGVDEADIVETDGQYLYVLAGQELVIFDAWPGKELQVVSRLEIDGQPFGEYLNPSGDRLTIISHAYRDILPVEPWGDVPLVGESIGFCPQPWPEPTVTVTVLDVSNPAGPTLVQKTELEGSYVDSRTIADSVYLVLRDQFVLPPPQPVPLPDDPTNGDDGTPSQPEFHPVEDARLAPDWWFQPPETEYVYETEAQYRERIEGQVLDLALPRFSACGPDGEPGEPSLLSEATDIYQPLVEGDTSLISVVVFDMSDDEPGPVSSTSVPTDWASEVYVSSNSLYLLGTVWSSRTETSILKLDFDETGQRVYLSATGAVPGRVLNQFSVDEYDNYLRIATTGGGWQGTENNVYVLEQSGKELTTVGALEDLAPGEQIYSARFMGDRGFLVTFRRIDPLFALDLSEPDNPRVTGELKIPGFSNYLQMIDDGHLIGIGRNADESTGRLQDPQVSLFDVENMETPVQLDRFTIDVGRWGWSEATTDHHAVGYYPEHDYRVLTIPVSRSGGWQIDTQRVYTPPQTDMWVFRIHATAEQMDAANADRPIEPLGRIRHPSAVRRTVRIAKLLYTISEDTVTVHEILDPDSEIARVVFAPKRLGVLDSATLSDLDLSLGNHWYQFEASETGRLRLAATGAESVRWELYDGQGELLRSSAGRLMDWLVDAGEEYSFRIHGPDDAMPDGTDAAAVSLAVDPSATDLAVENGAVVVSAETGLKVPGKFELQAAAELAWPLGDTAAGSVEVGGQVSLAGELTLQVAGSLPAAGPATLPMITAGGGVTGAFANFPAGEVLSEDVHLGHGVFLRAGTQAVTYGDSTVELHVFQAAPGDVNGDGRVGFNDIWAITSAGKYDRGPGPGVDWQTGDFNGSGQVDFDDIWLIVQNSLYDQGSYAATTAGIARAAKTRTLDTARAHDTMLERAARREAGRRETSSSKLAWLWDLGQMGTRQRPSRRHRLAPRAVDQLAASRWL